MTGEENGVAVVSEMVKGLFLKCYFQNLSCFFTPIFLCTICKNLLLFLLLHLAVVIMLCGSKKWNVLISLRIDILCTHVYSISTDNVYLTQHK